MWTGKWSVPITSRPWKSVPGCGDCGWNCRPRRREVENELGRSTARCGCRAGACGVRGRGRRSRARCEAARGLPGLPRYRALLAAARQGEDAVGAQEGNREVERPHEPEVHQAGNRGYCRLAQHDVLQVPALIQYV